MALLGTAKNPVICRVQTTARQAEVAALCAEHDLIFIIGVESGKPENLDDYFQALRQRDKRTNAVDAVVIHGRNQPCPCGGRKKYRKCCMGLAVALR